MCPWLRLVGLGARGASRPGYRQGGLGLCGRGCHRDGKRRKNFKKNLKLTIWLKALGLELIENLKKKNYFKRG
jgi:hypothetical protein